MTQLPMNQIVMQLEGLLPNIRDVIDGLEANPDITEVIKVYHHLEGQYKALDNARKEIYKQLERLDKGILPKKFEDAGLDLVRVPELSRSFYPTTKYGAKVHDKDKLYAWLKEIGQGDLITETVNSSSLAGLLKDMSLNEGRDAPEDVAQLTSYQTIGSSKYTPK